MIRRIVQLAWQSVTFPLFLDAKFEQLKNRQDGEEEGSADEGTAKLCEFLSQLVPSRTIHDLPSEVLAKIFELGIHEDHNMLSVIFLVSRCWNKVSRETPLLWSYIKLDHQWNYGRGAEFLGKIQRHIDCSKEMGLSIDLDFQYTDSLAEARAIMQALHPHLARCFSFRVSAPHWDHMSVAAEHFGEMRNTLENIALRIDPEHSHTNDTTTVPLLTGPFLHLKSVIPEQTPLACIFSESCALGLRKFHLVRSSRYNRMQLKWDSYFSALSSMPELEDVQLESATLGFKELRASFETPRDSHPLRLKNLVILDVNGRDIRAILKLFTFTSLVRLVMQLDGGPAEDGAQMLSSLRQSVRNGHLPVLDRLLLLDIPGETDATDLIRTLEGLPRVALRLTMPPPGSVSIQLIQALTTIRGNTGHLLLPKLRDLSLGGCRDISHLMIVQLKCARENFAGVEPIRTVDIAA